MALLEVENLQTHFRTPDGVNRAVDGVTFEVGQGERGSCESAAANPSPPIRSSPGPEPPAIAADRFRAPTSELDERHAQIRATHSMTSRSR